MPVVSTVASVVKPFIAGSCYPACSIDLRTRIRVVEHLCSRAGLASNCRLAVLAGAFPRLSTEQLAAADDADRLVRKACRAAVISCLAFDGLACRAPSAV